MMGLGKCMVLLTMAILGIYLCQISWDDDEILLKCIFFEWVLQPSTSYCLPLRLTEQEDSRRQNRCGSPHDFISYAIHA